MPAACVRRRGGRRAAVRSVVLAWGCLLRGLRRRRRQGGRLPVLERRPLLRGDFLEDGVEHRGGLGRPGLDKAKQRPAEDGHSPRVVTRVGLLFLGQAPLEVRLCPLNFGIDLLQGAGQVPVGDGHRRRGRRVKVPAGEERPVAVPQLVEDLGEQLLGGAVAAPPEAHEARAESEFSVSISSVVDLPLLRDDILTVRMELAEQRARFGRGRR